MKNKLLLAAIISTSILSGCKKEKMKDGLMGTTIGGTTVVYGCTDASATNYNASANTDDGSCKYNGSVTFYYNSWGSTATVYLASQTGQITQYYTGTPPACGASGCANFTLPTGIYNWTASSTWSNWNGQITVSKNACELVLLQ